MFIRRNGPMLLTGVVLVAGLLAGWGSLPRAGESTDLTEAARSAVEALFPGAAIVGVGQEREGGVLYYEVAVRDGEATVEIEVTPDGSVGEVEREVAMADLPPVVRDAIRELAEGASIEEVEHHEIRGVPEGATFDPVDPPVVLYEFEFERDGVWRELAVGADGKLLSGEDQDSDSEDHDSDSDEDDSSGDESEES